MNRNTLLTHLTLLLAILGGTSSLAHAERGRPVIDDSLGFKRLLSDRGTLLRGVSLSWDGGDPYGSQQKFMPSQASLDALARDYGYNTVHLYLEGDSSGNTDPVGYNVEDCDILVDRCAKAGLYLIITIGCNGENGAIHSMDFIQDFWKFYGPRYKDRTHVIYEAKNEPV
ncbi:MAG: glycoside hydrolase family 5 protein, partial [Actinomycetales bacterium]|nr:glycoside hydrolase family 5 protein [Actinomycetales bacterium]